MTVEPHPYRAYLVDDERLAIRRLSRMLEATGRVEIAGSATDPAEALNALTAQPVDVLFLDIQMPGLNGFELLERLPSAPMVVFTTAYDQYALKAFEVNSIDYLLKPVEPAQLERALAKLERWRSGGGSEGLRSQMTALFKYLATALPAAGSQQFDRIPSRVAGHIQFIELRQITHFVSEDKLTYAVAGGKKHVVDYSITELEKRLTAQRFLRIHRSTLVNLAWVQELHTWFGGQMVVRLKGPEALDLTVARDRVRTLKDAMML